MNKPLISILFALSIVLLFVHTTDTEFSHNWTIFALWLVNFTVAIYAGLSALPRLWYQKLYSIIKKDRVTIGIILILAALTRLALLDSYPFVKIGDGLRDAGLNGLRIHTGELKDVFGFGSYEGYGNFIPLISGFFGVFFKNSPIIYTLPAALVGVASIVGTYLLSRRVFGYYVATTASLFLVASLHHLHFSRTELVIIMDTLLILPILAATYLATITPVGVFLAGLVYGFSLHFYAGIRGMLIIAALYLSAVIAAKIVRLLRRGHKKKAVTTVKHAAVGVVLLFFGFFIGVGPRLNNFSSVNLSGTANAKLIFLDDLFKEATATEQIKTLYNTYTDAFLVYFSEPTTTHFREAGPLLAFPVNWLFMVGVFSLLAQRKRHSMANLLLATVFLLPFTNQVLLNHVGADHRIMSVLPVAIIIAAYGAVAFLRSFTLSPSSSKRLLIALLLITLTGQLLYYFFTRPSDFERDQEGVKEYVLQGIADYMRADKTTTHFYILDDEIYEYFEHHKEKFAFFAAPREVSYVNEGQFMALLDQKGTGRTSTFIATSLTDRLQLYYNQEIQTSCTRRSLLPNYHCPKDYYGSYSFYVVE